ncbi:carbohydrate-binding protein [Chitinilyticum piscinae]|uniref:Chitin-binding type-3 domain-containing protein n=1 Tax=Chitinilyticum piscinae TaxID=2866724 RepID=A0A8J7K9B1_9NEIS|nr:carbohydrate-binding protein [Chitinilyticum piscinae]MBE9611008.1 hypothetical protein [Chitinilyticum piscinae]
MGRASRVLLLLLLGGVSALALAAQPWREGRHYSAGERVSYHGRDYVARQGHEAAKGANWNPEAAASLWEPVQQNLRPEPGGSWQEGRHYRKGQFVSYQGRVYRALQDHEAVKGANWNPRQAPSLWEPVDDGKQPRLGK